MDRPTGGAHVAALADPDDRVARDVKPGRAAVAGARRGGASVGARIFTAAIDTEGQGRRPTGSDLDNAFGTGTPSARGSELAPARPSASTPTCCRRCVQRRTRPGGCSDDEYLALATADGPALDAVAALAGFDCAATPSATT